jgi:hypothetical protein
MLCKIWDFHGEYEECHLQGSWDVWLA